jgi:hypothetical protein
VPIQAIEVFRGITEINSSIQAVVPMGLQAVLQSQRTRDISVAVDHGEIWRLFSGGSQADRPEAYRLA